MKKIFSSTVFLTCLILALCGAISIPLGIKTSQFIKNRQGIEEVKITPLPAGQASILNIYLSAEDYSGALGLITPSTEGYKAVQELVGLKLEKEGKVAEAKQAYNQIEDSQLRQALITSADEELILPPASTPKKRKIRVGASWMKLYFADDLLSVESGFGERMKWFDRYLTEMDFLGADLIYWNMTNVWTDYIPLPENWYIPYDYFFDILAKHNVQLVCFTNARFGWDNTDYTLKEKFYDPALITMFAERYKDKKNKAGKKVIHHWCLAGDRVNNFDWHYWLKDSANYQLHKPAEIRQHNETVDKQYLTMGQVLSEVGNSILAGDSRAKITLCTCPGNAVVEFYNKMEKATSFNFWGIDSWGPHWGYADYGHFYKEAKKMTSGWVGIYQTGWAVGNMKWSGYKDPGKNIYDPIQVQKQAEHYKRVIRDCDNLGIDAVAFGFGWANFPESETTRLNSGFWVSNTTFWKGGVKLLGKRNKNFESVYKILREKGGR